jgi:hypothetical protein
MARIGEGMSGRAMVNAIVAAVERAPEARAAARAFALRTQEVRHEYAAVAWDIFDTVLETAQR